MDTKNKATIIETSCEVRLTEIQTKHIITSKDPINTEDISNNIHDLMNLIGGGFDKVFIYNGVEYNVVSEVVYIDEIGFLGFNEETPAVVEYFIKHESYQPQFYFEKNIID